MERIETINGKDYILTCEGGKIVYATPLEVPKKVDIVRYVDENNRWVEIER